MNKYRGIIELLARVVIKKGDQMLFCINKKSNAYFLPGGHVEFGDTLEQTIYKELKEELGWEKDIIQNIHYLSYLENSYTDGGEQHQELNIIFSAELIGEVEIRSQEDHIDFAWVNRSEVSQLKILPAAIVEFIK